MTRFHDRLIFIMWIIYLNRADSGLAPSQWETSLQSNAVSHWLSASPESRIAPSQWETSLQSNAVSHWLGASIESALFKPRNTVFETMPRSRRQLEVLHPCSIHQLTMCPYYFVFLRKTYPRSCHDIPSVLAIQKNWIQVKGVVINHCASTRLLLHMV